jgi:hypothetical protein
VAHTAILATWEAEILRIAVLGQSGQKSHGTPSQPIAGHGGAPIISATQPAQI